MKILSTCVLLFLVFSCKQKYDLPHVIIQTNLGDIEAELYPARAPKSVAAFLENIRAGVYKNGSFYRVLKAEELPASFNPGLIQGGAYQKPGGPHKFIGHEPTTQTGLSHADGILSFARTLPGTASTEFFICIGDQSQYDAGQTGTSDSLGFAAFGKVVKGFGIVKQIQNQKSTGDRFDEPVKISEIEVQ